MGDLTNGKVINLWTVMSDPITWAETLNNTCSDGAEKKNRAGDYVLNTPFEIYELAHK